MVKTYVEQILSARRLAIGRTPDQSLCEPSSGRGRSDYPYFDYVMAEVRDSQDRWREEILVRYYHFSAVRGVVGVLAAGLVSPLAATYVLGLKKGGDEWIQSHYPSLRFGDYGMSVSTRNGQSIADCLEVVSITNESAGAFDLLTLGHPRGDIQFLFCHNHPTALIPVSELGRLSFQEQGLDAVVQTMTRYTLSLRAINDFSCFQVPEIWSSFVSVIEDARSSFNVPGNLTFSMPGITEINVESDMPYWARDDQFKLFSRIVRLAQARYGPRGLLRRSQHFHPAMAAWFRESKFSPVLVLHARDYSPREQLLSRARLENWLALGRVTVQQVAEWDKREIVRKIRDFALQHKKNTRQMPAANLEAARTPQTK